MIRIMLLIFKERIIGACNILQTSFYFRLPLKDWLWEEWMLYPSLTELQCLGSSVLVPRNGGSCKPFIRDCFVGNVSVAARVQPNLQVNHQGVCSLSDTCQMRNIFVWQLSATPFRWLSVDAYYDAKVLSDACENASILPSKVNRYLV